MVRKTVQIVDYGVGNLASVGNMIIKIGGKPIVIKNLRDLDPNERIILPGVGSFDAGMKSLENSNLIPILNEAVNANKVPFLGICLGMQLLFDRSEEGVLSGLGWISGSVTKLTSGNDSAIKIPHMGWNTVEVARESALSRIEDEQLRFYFVHSYHVNCKNEENILMTTNYGAPFVSAVQNENIFGAQFHPEKSHRFGMKFLSEFLKI